MVDKEWQGGGKDERLYRKVRQGKQELIREKYDRLKRFLDERRRRLWAANEALAFGHGGVRAVAEALRMSAKTVIEGRRELESEGEGEQKQQSTLGRQRRPGGGRKSVTQLEPAIVKAIEAIVDPATRGDPMSPLKWTSKSLIKISGELKARGWSVSATTVGKILHENLKYNLQALKKTREGSRQHPDRDAQFQYLSQQCRAYQQRGLPVISVDAKKKELIGDFKNAGREWAASGEAGAGEDPRLRGQRVG